MIPFAPPRIDKEIIDEVVAALQSGWITTGPRAKEFERMLTAYCGNEATLCLNSATAGLELVLRWYGVGEGDEVILPAYTYASTANVVMHCGALPVMVDITDEFNVDVNTIRAAITDRTKVIMPVDFGGFPCDYQAINSLVQEDEVIALFKAASSIQKQMGRILVLSDAAHSLGAISNGVKTGSLTDISVFSFHAVKNLTTAEGGAIALNLPPPFNNNEVYSYLSILALHGQNKDAFAKLQRGNWRYDIITPGYKCNMTDIAAAIGIVELKRYEKDMIPYRRHICNVYNDYFGRFEWARTPVIKNSNSESSCHLYPLRIKNISEVQRDLIIQKIFDRDVAVNVHFIPLPMMSYYKSLGYNINQFPVSYSSYKSEISLPVYYGLTDEQLRIVCKAVVEAVEEVLLKVSPIH